MIRGEVHWTELTGDAGFRPVVIVSRHDSLAKRQNVTVAEITRTVRRLPSEVPLSTAQGMPAICVINTDNIHTVPLDHIRTRITSLKGEVLFRLDQALRYSLGLDREVSDKSRRLTFLDSVPHSGQRGFGAPVRLYPHWMHKPRRRRRNRRMGPEAKRIIG